MKISYYIICISFAFLSCRKDPVIPSPPIIDPPLEEIVNGCDGWDSTNIEALYGAYNVIDIEVNPVGDIFSNKVDSR